MSVPSTQNQQQAEKDEVFKTFVKLIARLFGGSLVLFGGIGVMRSEASRDDHILTFKVVMVGTTIILVLVGELTLLLAPLADVSTSAVDTGILMKD